MKFPRPPAAQLLDVAFFAGFLAYAIAGLDTRLIHHWQAPSFYLTRQFAGEFLPYPGGILDYLYRLIAQTYASQIGGALVLTALVAAVSALTGPMLRFLPPILLLYSLNLYYDHTPVVLAMLLGLAAARRPRLFLVLVAPLYWIGGMALVFFAAAVVGTELARRRFRMAALYLLLAAALPIVVERLIYVPSPARDWFANADWRKAAIWWALYLCCFAAGFLRNRKLPAKADRWVAVAAVAALAAMAVLAYDTNARDRRLAAVDYFTTHQNWPAVLAAADRLTTSEFNSLTRYEVNLALHETHRFGDEMFRYPQSGSTLPPLRTEVFLPYMIRLADLFLRLGRISDAEHYGSEAAILGPSDPRVLRLLADVNLVRGRNDAAQKLLATLSTEVGSSPPAAAVDLARHRMIRNDDFIPVWQNPDRPDADANRLLADQLQQDPSNRMAFEFLMGNLLLARDLTAARALMPAIRFLHGPAYETADGRRRTPRYYQEAMAMFRDATGQPLELQSFAIDPETLNQITVFKRLMSQSPGREAAMQAAWSRFRDSYFFYYVFGPGDYR